LGTTSLFIQQAVEDGATVSIYYESRLAKLALKEPCCPRWISKWMTSSQMKMTFLVPNGRRVGPQNPKTPYKFNKGNHVKID
jgi:hypothetical protein